MLGKSNVWFITNKSMHMYVLEWWHKTISCKNVKGNAKAHRCWHIMFIALVIFTATSYSGHVNCRESGLRKGWDTRKECGLPGIASEDQYRWPLFWVLFQMIISMDSSACYLMTCYWKEDHLAYQSATVNLYQFDCVGYQVLQSICIFLYIFPATSFHFMTEVARRTFFLFLS